MRNISSFTSENSLALRSSSGSGGDRLSFLSKNRPVTMNERHSVRQQRFQLKTAYDDFRLKLKVCCSKKVRGSKFCQAAAQHHQVGTQTMRLLRGGRRARPGPATRGGACPRHTRWGCTPRARRSPPRGTVFSCYIIQIEGPKEHFNCSA